MSSQPTEVDRSSEHLDLYFRFGFLNGLRDEVWLTLTLQAKTLHHLLAFILLIAGLTGGLVRAYISVSWIPAVLGCAFGVAGFILSWSIAPRLEWALLLFMYKKRWCMHRQDMTSTNRHVELLTPEVYAERARLWSQKDNWLSAIYIPTMFCMAIALWYVANLFENAPNGVMVLIGTLFAAAFLGIGMALKRARKRFGQELGLLCARCGRLITGLDGGFGIPPSGRCKHCGLQVFVNRSDDRSVASKPVQ
jgi:hypothetical protein